MNGGGFRLDPDAAKQVFKAIEDTARTLKDEWRAAEDIIAMCEAGIGGDEIAMAFRTRYDRASSNNRHTAGTLHKRLDEMAAAGHASVRNFQDMDENHATRMPGLPPIQGPR